MSIKEEAFNLEILKNDVDEIENKIYCEMMFLENFLTKFDEIEAEYFDKKSSLEDLAEFKNCIIEQERFIKEMHKSEKDKLYSEFTEGLFQIYNL